MTKFIFVGGKGGVGKSTVSSSIALHLSDKHKVLLVSTDPVLALSDIWNTNLTNKPKKLRNNLYAKHINPDLFAKKRLSSPCESEKAALSELTTHLLSNDFDYVVFDTAPTGHTLSLLKKPEEWKDFIETTPLACGVEAGDSKKYDEVLSVLRSSKTSFIFVLIPELLSVKETKRAHEQLKAFGIKRFSFVFNMFIPEKIASESAFMMKRHDMQIKHMNEAKEFSGCCTKIIELQDSEVNSAEKLANISKQIFGGCC